MNMDRNEIDTSTVAGCICTHCTKSVCTGCDVEGLQNADYEEIVNALLQGFSMSAIRQSFVAAAV